MVSHRDRFPRRDGIIDPGVGFLWPGSMVLAVDLIDQRQGVGEHRVGAEGELPELVEIQPSGLSAGPVSAIGYWAIHGS